MSHIHHSIELDFSCAANYCNNIGTAKLHASSVINEDLCRRDNLEHCISIEEIAWAHEEGIIDENLVDKFLLCSHRNRSEASRRCREYHALV